MTRDFNNQDDHDTSVEELQVIVERVLELLEKDIFSHIFGITMEPTGKTKERVEKLDNLLADIRTNIKQYKTIELATYLRTSFSHGIYLLNWNPLLEESIRLSEERKCDTSDVFYGLTAFPKSQSDGDGMINLNQV
jgi:hypothetical protein